MAYDRTPLPIDDAGNREGIRSIEFHEADAYLLYQTMVLGAATGICYSSPNTIRRLQYYAEQFKAFAPPAAAHLENEYILPEVLLTMRNASHWSIWRHKDYRWSDRFNAMVMVGDKTWRAAYNIDGEAYVAIVQMLTAFAPMSCTRTEAEDTVRA